MASFQLREPSYNELPQIARLLAKAFWDDEILGDMMHPHRAQYPQDYELWFLQGLRGSFWNARCRMLVAITENSNDGSHSTILGFAKWDHVGQLRIAKVFNIGKFFQPVITTSAKIQIWTRPNRASDPRKANVLQQTAPFTKHMWSGERAEAWHLEFLGVDPDHQGKGVGKVLVRRGLEWADTEGIYASVTSARGKDGFYKSCGYHIQDGHVGMGDGNPLANCKGGNMWWKKPEGRQYQQHIPSEDRRKK